MHKNLYIPGTWYITIFTTKKMVLLTMVPRNSLLVLIVHTSVALHSSTGVLIVYTSLLVDHSTIQSHYRRRSVCVCSSHYKPFFLGPANTTSIPADSSILGIILRCFFGGGSGRFLVDEMEGCWL